MDKRGEKDKMKKRAFITGIFVLAVMALVVGAMCAAGAIQIGGEAETQKVIIILNGSMLFDEAKEEINPILCISKSVSRDLEIIHGIAVELPKCLLREIMRLPVVDKVLPDRKVSLLPLPKTQIK